MARLKETYLNEIVDAMMKKFEYKNERLKKVITFALLPVERKVKNENSLQLSMAK